MAQDCESQEPIPSSGTDLLCSPGTPFPLKSSPTIISSNLFKMINTPWQYLCSPGCVCRPNHTDNPVPAGFSGHHPSNASFPVYWVSEPGTTLPNKYWSPTSQHSLTWSLQPPYLPSHCIISNIQGWRSSAHGITLLFFISVYVQWFLCGFWLPYLGQA